MDPSVDEKRKTGVAHVTGWTSALVALLTLLWGPPFLRSLEVRSFEVLVATAIALSLGTWLLLNRVWRSWHVQPSRLGRVVAGVVAGLLLMVAHGEATSPTHAECISGHGSGEDAECDEYEEVPGPSWENVGLALLGASAFVYFATVSPDE